MKTKILQRGGSKVDHQTLVAAADFYAKKLMSTRMANTLSLRIEMRSSKLDKDTDGQVLTKAVGSRALKAYTIQIDRDAHISKQLSTLAHEMVHVQQFATGRLQIRVWRTDRKLHARWEGAELGTEASIPYMQRPWEIEAFAKQHDLAMAFLDQDAAGRTGNDRTIASLSDEDIEAIKAKRKAA